MLHQVAYTKKELETIMKKHIRKYTPRFETKEKQKYVPYLTMYSKGKKPGRRPTCAGCKDIINDGLVIEIEGKYKCSSFSINKVFRMHVLENCLRMNIWNSDIKEIPKRIQTFQIQNDEIGKARLQLGEGSEFVIV